MLLWALLASIVPQPVSAPQGVGQLRTEPSPFCSSPVLVVGDPYALLLWEDTRNLGYAAINAARITSDGGVLDATGLALPVGVSPAAAFDGTRFLVAYVAGGGPGLQFIRGAFVDLDGGVGAPLTLSTPVGSDQFAPSVAWNGISFVVAWTDNRAAAPGVYFTQVSSAGAPSSPRGVFLLPGVTGASRAAEAGAIVGVAAIATGRLTLMRLAGEVVLDDGGVLIDLGNGVVTSPALASDDAGFMLSWRSGTDLLFNRVDAVGTPDTPAPIATPSRLRDHPAVLGGAQPVFAWEEPGVGGGSRVVARFLGRSDIMVSGSASSIVPSVARAGPQVLTVFQDNGPAPLADVMLRPVNPPASTVGAARFAALSAQVQLLPSVTFSLSGSLVVWTERRGASFEIVAARFDRGGALIDSTPLLVSASSVVAECSLTTDGTDYLVTWTDWLGGSTDTWARVVRANGALEPVHGLGTLVGVEEEGAVATFDGAHYVAAWLDNGATSIGGALLDTDGTVITQTRWLVAFETAQVVLAAGGGAVMLGRIDLRTGDLRVSPLITTATTVSAAAGPGTLLANGQFLMMDLEWHAGAGAFAAVYATRTPGSLYVRHATAAAVSVETSPVALRTGLPSLNVQEISVADTRDGLEVLFFEYPEALVLRGRLTDAGFAVLDGGFDHAGGAGVPGFAVRGGVRQVVTVPYVGTPSVRALRVKTQYLGGLVVGETCAMGGECLSGRCAGTCLRVDGGTGAGGGSAAGQGGGSGGTSGGTASAPLELDVRCGCRSMNAPLLLALALTARKFRGRAPRR